MKELILLHISSVYLYQTNGEDAIKHKMLGFAEFHDALNKASDHFTL